MSTALSARDVARACGIAVLTLTAAYLLLAVLPFYANGIHLRSYQEIAGSFVDVKGYAPFTWLGGPAQGIAMLAAGYTPLASLLLTPLLGALLWLKWRSFRETEGALWIATCAANVVAMALTWQARGIILTWLVD